MEIWTIAQPLAGRYRLHIQFGACAYWCMFDYAIARIPSEENVSVVMATGADSVTTHFFPHIRAGMLRGLSEDESKGRRLAEVKIEIRKIYVHSTDTTADGCERYGRSFIDDLIWHKCVPVVINRLELDPHFVD